MYNDNSPLELVQYTNGKRLIHGASDSVGGIMKGAFNFIKEVEA